VKFVLHWETRTGSSGRDNLTDLKNLLDVFGKWEGFAVSVQVTEWVISLADGGVGWLVCTTDDSEALMSAVHKFVPWLTFTLTPVMDVQAGAAVMAESAAWVESQV
jgi:Protein of unknown function (DUF3303)